MDTSLLTCLHSLLLLEGKTDCPISRVFGAGKSDSTPSQNDLSRLAESRAPASAPYHGLEKGPKGEDKGKSKEGKDKGTDKGPGKGKDKGSDKGTGKGKHKGKTKGKELARLGLL